VEYFKVMPQKPPGETNKGKPLRDIYNRAEIQTE
jgi:hypothetical protein